MLEAPIRLQRAQEGLLKRVLGSLRADAAPKKPKHLGAVLLVEVLERGDRHALHHPVLTTQGRVSVSMSGCEPLSLATSS